MGGIFGVLLGGGVASIAYLLFWVRSRERMRLWQEAAKAVGMTDLAVSTYFGVETKLTGNVGPLQVTIEVYQRGKEEHGTRVIVGGLRHGPYDLTIRPEGLGSTIKKSLGERELEVGDPAFDDVAYLQGAPALVRAIFDQETRRLAGRLLNGQLLVEGRLETKTLKVRVSVSDGCLRLDIPARLLDDTTRWLPAVLPSIVEVGRRLRRPDDLAARIAENTRSEKVRGVRLANLRTLTTDYPRHAATREALLASLYDESPSVKLHAAIALGPEGRNALVDLASSDSPDTVVARAITALGADFPGELAIERLRRASEAGHSATALACIEAVGRAGSASGIEALAGALASAADEVAVAAARTLAATAGDAAEPPLVAALEHESAVVRVAAAEGLGAVGSPRSVVSLRNAASAHTFDGALRRAARQAIAEIKSRVTGASPGQLSLAADEPGRVSLVDEDQRGRVSLDSGEDA